MFQGIGGGGLAPVEQSMLADTFPPEKRGMAFAAFAIVVVVGPVLGPTLGGYITETSSWHWVFLINVPVGIVACFLAEIFVDEPEQRARRTAPSKLKGGLKIDYIGVAAGRARARLPRTHARSRRARGLVLQRLHRH